jgi:hypothetical protein
LIPSQSDFWVRLHFGIASMYLFKQLGVGRELGRELAQAFPDLESEINPLIGSQSVDS